MTNQQQLIIWVINNNW